MALFKTPQFGKDICGDEASNQLLSVPHKKYGLKNKLFKVKQNVIQKSQQNVKNKVDQVKKHILKKAGQDFLQKEFRGGNNSKSLLQPGNSSTSQKKKRKNSKKPQTDPITNSFKKDIKSKTVASATNDDQSWDHSSEITRTKNKNKKKEDKLTLLPEILPSNRQKFQKKKHIKFNADDSDNNEDNQSLLPPPSKLDYKSKNKQKAMRKLAENLTNVDHRKPKSSGAGTLRQKMIEKLKSARFRFINEQIYSTDSKAAQKFFKTDPEAFKAYHQGYRQQVNKWPLNPVDVIIAEIRKMSKTHIVADFGCGEAKIETSVPQKVHSFDLVASNSRVTACDMAHVPLENSSVNIVVFCLSLMGTNLQDYIMEANRVLKVGGVLKIAEVESRFEDVNNFIEGVSKFQFKNTHKDLSHNLFYFLDFQKLANLKNKTKLPTLGLHPCLYKKR